MVDTNMISVELNASQVPSIIKEQFTGLKVLKENVSEAIRKADSAKNSAKLAKDKSTGLFQKKAAIESLQEATVDLADAQISTAHAMEVSFEYQQKLAEITKFLFALGVSNIAMNRSVVRELELKLKGASEEELDEFARQELIAVVKQLKAQEDIMKKQSDLSEKVKAHEVKLRTHEQRDTEYEKLLKEQLDHEEKQNALLEKQAEKDREHDKILAEKAEKDKIQDAALARQAEIDAEHAREIAAGLEKDRRQDEQIARQAEIDAELARLIEVGEEKNRNQDKEIARQAERDEELSMLVNQLLESSLVKDAQIIELQAVCDKLSKKISDNEVLVENMEKGIIEKLSDIANKKLVYISYVVGATGLIVAVVQFFI